MVNNFLVYFTLGWEHIVSTDALDHQLFLLALAAWFTIRDWRKLIVLITAFTLGHCLTLGLGATGTVRLPSYWVELLIPGSIAVVSLANLPMLRNKTKEKAASVSYLMAALFGLVHGLGFANTLRALLGHEQSILFPLFGFNVGLEFGQVVVVVCLLGIQWLLMRLFNMPVALWARFVSTVSLAGSLWMIAERAGVL